MRRNFRRLLKLAFLLASAFLVAELIWVSGGCLQYDASLPLLNHKWPRQIPFKYREIREHLVSTSKTILPRDNPLDAHVKVTGNKTLRDRSSEDMADKWCQYMKKSNKVNPHPYKFSITAKSLCSSDTPFMMIIVPSVCSHDYVRRVIRQTWGSVVHTNTWSDGQKLPPIKLAFMFGYPETQACSDILQNESKKYGDIIVSEFRDTYRNLTLKSVAALKWISYYCPHVQYVLKCDEDTFVHLPRLVKYIRALNSSNILIGRITTGIAPFTSGRWEVNANQYPFRVFTPYLQGQAYVLPGKIVPKLYELSEYFDFVPLEDVFVTGILGRCAKASYCERRPCGYLNLQVFNLDKEAKCNFYIKQNIVSFTELKAEDLLTLWNTFKNDSECFKLYSLFPDLKLILTGVTPLN